MVSDKDFAELTDIVMEQDYTIKRLLDLVEMQNERISKLEAKRKKFWWWKR